MKATKLRRPANARKPWPAVVTKVASTASRRIIRRARVRGEGRGSMLMSTMRTPGDSRRAASSVAFVMSSAKWSRISSGRTSSVMCRKSALQARTPRRLMRSGAWVRLTARSENSTTRWPARTAARPSFWRMA